MYTPKTIDARTRQSCDGAGPQTSMIRLRDHPTNSFMAREKDLERQVVTTTWLLSSGPCSAYRCRPRADSKPCWHRRWLSSNALTEARRIPLGHGALIHERRFVSFRKDTTTARTKLDEELANEGPVRTTHFQLLGKFVSCYRVSRLVEEIGSQTACHQLTIHCPQHGDIQGTRHRCRGIQAK